MSQNGQLVAEVFYTARVCNTGNSQLTNITLADDHDGNHDSPNPSTIASLAPGACTAAGAITGSYFPDRVDSGTCSFSDIIRVTGATAALGSNPPPAVGCPSSTDLACAPVTCPMCQ
ncbi:MAG: hypothetical protein DMF57_17585 [Acidobacteria bacterium]|nr:MAG: hypothetical protein DMF57_17585 [Acidobacteriota bacterium]